STDTASPYLSSLSLHDALPIFAPLLHQQAVDRLVCDHGRPVRPALHHRRVVAHVELALQLLAGVARNALRLEDRFDVLLVRDRRSEEHTSELQSLTNLVCRLLL